MNKLIARIIVATIIGILLGAWHLYSTSGGALTQIPIQAWIGTLSTVGITGFAIGISAIKIRWILHGMLIGLITAIPAALEPLVFADYKNFVMFLAFGAVYGLLIEVFTSGIFKLKRE